jgi:hypothetical protein
VGITISDNNSGVNANTIEYSFSENGGETWSSWASVEGYKDGKTIDVKVKLTLQNRTENRIRWRATDIAGNGPFRSRIYIINVSKPIPKVRQLSPTNGSVINTTKVTLIWELEDEDVDGFMTYKIYFGSSYPPSNVFWPDDSKTNYEIDGLSHNVTYYWKVDIIIDGFKKYPSNETWWFKIKLEPVVGEKIYKIDIIGFTYFSYFQGENGSIELFIQNQGNTRDKIRLEILAGNLSPYISLENISNLELSSKKTGKRVLILKLPENITSGNYEINILAISLNSDGQEKDSHTIHVEIKELIIPGSNNNNSETSKKSYEIIWYLIVLIIIIVLIIVFAIIIKQKKSKGDDELFDKEQISIKTGQPSLQVASTDEQLTPSSFPQLAEKTNDSGLQQIPQSSVPQLVKSTQIAPESTQAQQSQVPQLPPAFRIQPQSQESIAPTIARSPSIAPVSEVNTPNEQPPRITPTLASTDSPTQIQNSPTLAQPEKVTENVNEKSQPSE